MRFEDDLSGYEGRWVAHAGGRVIAQGGTPEQALNAARQERYKEKPSVMYVPPQPALRLPSILEKVRQALPGELDIYIVGGAVRDALLQIPSKDLDFALPRGAIAVARQVADRIGAAFFALNQEFDTARLILYDEQGDRVVMDFAGFRGPTLEADLQGRDFTINAIAAEIQPPHRLHDPLGGAADLLAGNIRACSSTSLSDDPVRVLRAVRLAARFHFHIEPATRKLLKEVAGSLSGVSPERMRDELWRILDGPQPATALRALDKLGALEYFLPDLAEMKGLEQSPPHVDDAWEHTLNTVQKLEDILAVLGPTYDPENPASNLRMGLAVMRLGRYRAQIDAHLHTPFTPDRALRPLLFLAALYHDIGKPATRTQEAGGRIRFFKHEQVGAEIAGRRAAALRLSNDEAQRLKAIIRGHMRPILLSESGIPPSRKAIYRFFRDLNVAGVDVCLLTLADYLAVYGHTVIQERWVMHLEVVRSLLEAWWENPAESISPPSLIDGGELMAIFKLPQGPQIGELLALVREAHAAGEVLSREDALAFVDAHLKNQNQG
jgi:poly(A) polymerase